MGVQNLWLLLAPVGRQIEIESLKDKVVAVDASIWLTQFVKAMRDDDGHMIKNAHLIGTFHRVAKLLYYQIKPVFIFDGQTPDIKIKTIAKRRKKQESQNVNYKQTAQKILLNRLKLYKKELCRNGDHRTLEVAPAIDPNVLIAQARNSESVTLSNCANEEGADYMAEQIRKEDCAVFLKGEDGIKRENNDEEDDEMQIDNLELNDSEMTKIDPGIVSSLPQHLQKDMMEKILRNIRQSARDRFIPLAGNPEAYSKNQIKTFLVRSQLHQKFMAVRQQNMDEGSFKIVEGSMPTLKKTIVNDSSRYCHVQTEIAQKPDAIDPPLRLHGDIQDIENSEDIDTENHPHPLSQLHERKHSENGYRSRFEDKVEFAERPSAATANKHILTELKPQVPSTSVWLNSVSSGISHVSEKPLAIEVRHRRKQKICCEGALMNCTNEVKNTVTTTLDTNSAINNHCTRSTVSRKLDEDTNTMYLSEEESQVEWEDVARPSSLQALSTMNDERSIYSDNDVSLEDSSEQVAEAAVEDTELDDAALATFQSKIEEDKAEQDLLALRNEALTSAIATASNLTQWAASAVRKALTTHITSDQSTDAKILASNNVNSLKALVPDISLQSIVVEDNDDQSAASKLPDITDIDRHDNVPRYLGYKSILQLPADNSNEISLSSYAQEYESRDALEKERVRLKTLRNRQLRDIEGLNDEMVEEVMELLRLFGVPYLICPMEAEAQCAALEQLGLVDGIITDDSDIFPFGGTKIYKNIFHHQNFVEAFYAKDIERELGFTREDFISLAHLLGSDYTSGIRGIGIVNATEIVTAFGNGLKGLKAFKEWVNEFDINQEAAQIKEKRKTEDELGEMDAKERFICTHAKMRRKWEIGDDFPNQRVSDAYLHPQVDSSKERFQWDSPDYDVLQEFCREVFGWHVEKVDSILMPLKRQESQKKMESIRNQIPKGKQTRIDQYFRGYQDNVKYAKIRSKRLRSALHGVSARKKKQQ